MRNNTMQSTRALLQTFAATSRDVFSEARQIWEADLHPDALNAACMLACCNTAEHVAGVLQTCRVQGITPSFPNAILFCSASTRAEHIYRALLTSDGHSPGTTQSAGTALLHVYAKQRCSDVSSAKDVFKKAIKLYAQCAFTDAPEEELEEPPQHHHGRLSISRASPTQGEGDRPLSALLACSVDRSEALYILDIIVGKFQGKGCTEDDALREVLDSTLVTALNLSEGNYKRAEMLFMLGYTCSTCVGGVGLHAEVQPSAQLAGLLPLDASVPATLAIFKTMAKTNSGVGQALRILNVVVDGCICNNDDDSIKTPSEEEGGGGGGEEKHVDPLFNSKFWNGEVGEETLRHAEEEVTKHRAKRKRLEANRSWAYNIDPGILGILYACCQSQEELNVLRRYDKDSNGDTLVTNETLARAIEWHHGGLTEVLYNMLYDKTGAEPDEWCLQALFRSLNRTDLATPSKTPLEFLRIRYVYSGLLTNPSLTLNEWTIASVLTCARNTREAAELLNMSFWKSNEYAEESRFEDIPVYQDGPADVREYLDCVFGRAIDIVREAMEGRCGSDFDYQRGLRMCTMLYMLHQQVVLSTEQILHQESSGDEDDGSPKNLMSPRDLTQLSAVLSTKHPSYLRRSSVAPRATSRTMLWQGSMATQGQSARNAPPANFLTSPVLCHKTVFPTVEDDDDQEEETEEEEAKDSKDDEPSSISKAFLRKQREMLKKKLKIIVSVKHSTNSFLSVMDVGEVDGLWRMYYQRDEKSLTGVNMSAKGSSGGKFCYITDSRQQLLDQRYAGLTQHLQQHALGKTWVLSSFNENLNVWESNSGDGRLSGFLQCVRVYVVKYWLGRVGFTYCCKAVEYLAKDDTLALLYAIVISHQAKKKKKRNLRKGRVQIVDHRTTRSAPKANPLPDEFSPLVAASGAPCTAPTPVLADAGASTPFLYQPHEAFSRTSLTVAYNYELKKKNQKGPKVKALTRNDVITSETMQALLQPLKEFFNCSLAMAERTVTLEEFVHEVSSSYGITHTKGEGGRPDAAPVSVSQHGTFGGDLHRGLTPSASLQASMRRRKLATKFLGSIVSERDPFAKEKVHNWIEASAVSLQERPEGAEETHDGGLLLGITRPQKTENSSERGSHGSQHYASKIPMFSVHDSINEWEPIEDTVQPLIMRVDGIPIFGCSYVQTFETRAEKAEKRRLEKRAQERDALGVTVWDGRGSGKRQTTLASIKKSIALRRDWKKKAQPNYKSLLEQPSVFRVCDPEEHEKGSECIKTEDGSTAKDPISGTHGSDTSESAVHEEYDPNLLDDPEIKSEKKRKVLAIPSLRCTVIPYSKPKDLKKDLNQQFLLTHPWIEETGLTLTGIRKAKNIMINLALKDDPSMEAATVAYAVVYFEWLILNQYKHLTKGNRKLVASICCVLSFKFWESDTGSTRELAVLLNDLEDHFDVPKQKILESEFAVYALLKFDLLMPVKVAETHFERLLALYNITSQEYSKKDQGSWGLKLREEGTATVVKLTGN